MVYPKLKALSRQGFIMRNCCLVVPNFKQSISKIEPTEQVSAFIMHSFLKTLYSEFYLSGIKVI